MNTITIDPGAARSQMVRQQVRTSEVFDDTILQVLDQLPRHEFVPRQFANLAYADTRIPLGHGEVMMTPITEGRLLQALDLRETDRVLEIGTGSGFLTACLASLASSVLSLDIYPEFTERAAASLARAQLENAELLTQDAMRDLPKDSFDAIAITGSVKALGERWTSMLKPGGRLFAVVGEMPVMQAVKIQQDSDSARSQTALFETAIPALRSANPESTFSF